jgi:polyisoprenoid-binding protein YceI
MITRTGAQRFARLRPARSRRHWWRWILTSLVALVVVIALAIVAFIKLQPTQAPLHLPAGAASAPVGPTAGTWHVGPGSLAGFRVQESALGVSNYTVGRTSAVTGELVAAGNQVRGATLRVDLQAIMVAGRKEAQFATSLDTRAFPVATFTLTQPVPVNAGLAAGATVRATARGMLEMDGMSRPVTVAVEARRDGLALEIAGAIPVSFAAWHIAQPAGFGFLGSLADHGVAEFLLVLRR